MKLSPDAELPVTRAAQWIAASFRLATVSWVVQLDGLIVEPIWSAMVSVASLIIG